MHDIFRRFCHDPADSRLHLHALAMFDALSQAEIVRGRLLAEEIACVMVDRSLLLLGIVADGIELQVAQADLARARVVLATDYSGELEEDREGESPGAVSRPAAHDR